MDSEPNIYELYEQNIGLISPIIADKLRLAEDTFPHRWVVDAFREAMRANVRRWAYIEAILDRWAVEGRGPLDNR